MSTEMPILMLMYNSLYNPLPTHILQVSTFIYAQEQQYS